jgi:BioD-like phosphotransacetylase family protein
MLAVTVQEIADHLGGQWVQEPVNTDALVERFLIGGNIMDAGSTYFGRFPSQAVVTRAARPDIQMASLMEDTRCLVLTGGSQPTDYVKAEALQRDVALILVEDSTMDTADALGTILSRTTAHSPSKVRKFLELLNQSSDLSSLTSALH